MRILYVALDQRVPGSDGGAVHVHQVATGLGRLGHEVHVLTSSGDGPFPAGPVRWHAVPPPLGVARLRLLRAPHVRRLARTLNPDAVIERYYNFGGEGLLAARAVGASAVLEVNSPVVDHPRSSKRVLDRVLLAEPMRRWREWQCRAADLIVTPTTAILPAWFPDDRVLEVEWGADTDRFRPTVPPTAAYARRPDDVVTVFAGAFRSWHGAVHLVRAVRQLRKRGCDDVAAVFVGDGPERRRVQQEAEGLERVTFLGRIPHDQMPAHLSAADIGVAPFDLQAHPPLTLAFYWSPLKVFEYMAAGLPVVAPDIPRLHHIVREGREGVFYDAADPSGLANAIDHLRDVTRRTALGAAGRERVERLFSWDSHCQVLSDALRRTVGRE